jgi:hypothetical protein
MPKNQLFRVLPDIDIINTILHTFGLSSLNDTKFFTKESIKENNTINQLNDMKDKLELYYLPCKQLYIKDITEKRCIVILRQFIKVHGYTLISKERYIQGKKLNVYRVIEDDTTVKPTPKKKNKPIIISFQ